MSGSGYQGFISKSAHTITCTDMIAIVFWTLWTERLWGCVCLCACYCVQGVHLYMAVCFGYLVKCSLSSVRYCTVYLHWRHFYKVKGGKSDLFTLRVYVQWRTLDKYLYTRYHKNTTMFTWSPCTRTTRSHLTRHPNLKVCKFLS